MFLGPKPNPSAVMPTYVYRREDGSTFEIQQRISEDALTACPTTGQPVKRIISANTGLIFKGSGFYLTDYARKNGSDSSDSSDAKAGSTSSEKASDSTSATAEASTDTSTPSSSASGADS